MSLHWQISFGQLFDLLRPVAVALAILCSTWVCADARQRGLRRYAIMAWALATFVLPFTFLPLYLLARLRARTTNAERFRSRAARYAPPLAYAGLLGALAVLYFIHDYRSLDARLARASDARLREQHAEAAREYRAALRLVDDPHTHKLLGLELARTGQWPDALTELRAAERGGEPDAILPYHIANALDALGRHEEATGEYGKFLAGDMCAQPAQDGRCQRARARVNQPAGAPPAK